MSGRTAGDPTGAWPAKRRLLILGGTAEARELAALVQARLGGRVDVLTSLAGRTAEPLPLAGEVRSGGFGGTGGLAEFLRANNIEFLIDATHPFAEKISRHAADAAAASGVAHVALSRPAWQLAEGDRWIEAADAEEAARLLPSFGRRVWLTVGSNDFAAFAALRNTWFLVRRVDRPVEPLPLPDYTLIIGRGPFALADERRLIARYKIDVMVCRASGGAATEAKLIAAREARLSVVMIRRPPPPSAASVATPAEALAWLEKQLQA